MVAVVDAAAELRVPIRSAAPAGVTAGFVEPHAAPLGGKLDCGSETGETGADDMHCALLGAHGRAHMRPWRNASQSLSGFGRLTRAVGSRHPERTSAVSVARYIAAITAAGRIARREQRAIARILSSK